jgi:hypothetical protein
MRRRERTVQMLKRAVIDVGDPFRAFTVRLIRAGFSGRSRAQQNVFPSIFVDTPGEIPRISGLSFPADSPRREALVIASSVFLVDARDKPNTGLVDAEAI